MFQVGTAIEFPALHVMPDVDGPEGELHEHEYRVEVLLERARLDERGMVCDLDVLDDVLAGIDRLLRDQNVDKIQPPDAAAVTVEVFAEWAHGTIGAALGGSGVEMLTVRVYENADAFGGFSGPPG